MSDIFRISRIDSDVHFTIIKPGKHLYKVSLHEKESKLPIHVVRDWELTEGCTFFIGHSNNSKPISKKVTLKVTLSGTRRTSDVKTKVKEVLEIYGD